MMYLDPDEDDSYFGYHLLQQDPLPQENHKTMTTTTTTATVEEKPDTREFFKLLLSLSDTIEANIGGEITLESSSYVGSITVKPALGLFPGCTFKLEIDPKDLTLAKSLKVIKTVSATIEIAEKLSFPVALGIMSRLINPDRYSLHTEVKAEEAAED